MHKNLKPLSYKSLRIQLDPLQLHFKTTIETKVLTRLIGQERAIQALNFGIRIKSEGYNIFAMGPSGIGKRSLISKILISNAKKQPVPPDWCYIHNFETPQKPISLPLPAGRGYAFQKDMKLLIHEIAENITAVLESDAYQNGMKKISDKFYKIQKASGKDNSKIKSSKLHHLYKKKYEKEKILQLKLTKLVIAPLVKKLRKKNIKFPPIVKYLAEVQNDILEHINDFIKQDDKTNITNFYFESSSLAKYKVNLFVDNRNLKGAPIIFEENPSYSNLICRIEHTSEQGNLATNFTLIRPGSLHQANGGYLIIEARKFKKNKEAWEALKNALYTHTISIEEIEHTTDSIKPVSLNPYPIFLSVKIILLGDRNSYYSLCQNDNDFTQLFKVAVDFDELIERNNKNIQLYARLIGTIIAQKKLRPFNASAVAAIIDHSSRLAEDNEKLSTHISLIEDLIIESNYWANSKNKKIVNAIDVKKALSSQVYRMDRSRELYHEDIYRGFVIIKTDGKVIGQVNCLSVRRVGNFSYGHPTRVTARVRFSKGKFIDIQREIKLAGPMHSKAGLIISNFLASRFNQFHTFSFSASISFEQVYCWTDGDSASVGELCALLSALAKIPIHQYLAVTGSIDQYGKVQAVGGLNEKIEGFFDICTAQGLNGKQGVIIPAINKKNLMLREDIVEATKSKKFLVYPIKTIDQAILLLTGYPSGKRNKEGHFPPGTVYNQIEENIKRFAK